MTVELSVLAWGCILGLVHILLAVRYKTRQYGTKWNMGPRDGQMPPPLPVAGRLARAQANFFETFPIFAAAAIIVSLAHLNGRWSAIGACLWLGARIVYLPLYAAGIPVARTLVWVAGIAGLVLVLRPALLFTFG
jgi:uncharacterized MAPEG superfamily protein